MMKAKRGYTACSVSLFGTEGLPDSPDQIPVEHSFQKIIYPYYGHMLQLKKDVMKYVLEWLKSK